MIANPLHPAGFLLRTALTVSRRVRAPLQLQCFRPASDSASSPPSPPRTMLAIQVNEIGDERQLTMNTGARIPDISPTQCLVENHYAGLNFHDTYTRSGLYQCPSPSWWGGVVREVGDEVTEVKVGDRVVYLQEGPEGSYAEYTPIEHARLMPVPDEVAMDAATAAAVQGLTAHYLVNDSYNVRKGDWCVIHSAAGGTGQILVQMAAKAKGAWVIGTCSSESKADIARQKGCDFVLVVKDDEWPSLPELVKDIIRKNAKGPIVPSNYGPLNINDGVHVVFDGVGKNSALASLECLRPRGAAVLYGNASGAPPDINPLLLSKLGSLSITRPKLHDFLRTRSEVVERSGAVFDMVQQGELQLKVQETFPFSREGVVRGTRLLQGRGTVGKVLFDIRKGRKLHQRHQKSAEIIRASRKASLDGKVSNIDSDCTPKTIDEAYDVQALVKDAIVSETGAKVVGKKVAATSEMAQRSVDCDEPFHGNLFSHSTFAAGCSISIGEISLGLQEGFLLIEPEFAVRMNADTETGIVYTPDTIRELVGGIIPSVEIATSAFQMPELEAFKRLGAPSQCMPRSLVLGEKIVATGDALDRLDEHTCTLAVNGNKLADGVGNKVLGHPLNALCWLANAMGERGEVLRKGDIVSTGVCVDQLVLVKSGDSVTVDYGPLGEVTFDLTE
ncbi:hypothetical protein ACHAXT_008414 [Thalassiosira profunda]